MKIRKFRRSDLPILCEFQKENLEINFPDLPKNIKRFKRNLLEWSKKEPEGIKIVESEGRVIGYIWLNTKEHYGLVRHLFVMKEKRGKGIGRKLMKIAEDYFKDKNKNKVRLTVTLSNEKLVGFYKKLGYKGKRLIMERVIE